MKFMHTADWHVGKTLKGQNRLDEQEKVLAEIVGIALEQEVDAVLIAGDLYDVAAPIPRAQRLVNSTLLQLAQEGIEVVAIAGNHDHGRTFEAFRPLMRAARIEYAGDPKGASNGGIHRFTARSTGEQAIVALLPFLSRRFAFGAYETMTGSAADLGGHYDAAIREMLRHLAKEFRPHAVNIVMAHVTCSGGVIGGGEREAQSIFEYHVPAHAFPEDASYVALGHLHRRQSLPAACPVHYSGSPIAVDFGEQENEPVVCIVEASPGLPAKVTDAPITTGRRLRTLTGTLEQLTPLAEEAGDDYLRIVLEEPGRVNLRGDVLELFPNALEIRIAPSFIPEQRTVARDHAGLSPRELFERYQQDEGFTDERVTALFDDLLEEVSEG